MKPGSEVHVSLSSSAQTKKHDDKTKSEAKGKSPVESTGYRNLSSEFEDFSDNSINKDNVARFLKLEDITYSDEEDVGVAADFTNLETTITVSPIPITRVHKDHPVTQIISDLSLTTQTRSMTRVVKDQGGLTQINNEDFHTCIKTREENVQQYVIFPLWSFGSKNPQNTDDDAAFGGKKPEFEGMKPESENTDGDAAFDEKESEFDAKKPESEVNVSLSSSAQSKKHDDKTTREEQKTNKR
nr:hypothetical protein [Tanacetum cinerariifolium]